MKMKYILPILCLLFTFVSCQEDNTPPPPNPNPNYTEVGPSMEFGNIQRSMIYRYFWK